MTWEDIIIILVAILLGMGMKYAEKQSVCPPYCVVDHMHLFRFPTAEGQGGKWDCQSRHYQDCVNQVEIAASP